MKIRSVSSNSIELAAIEEAGVVRDARRLLHVVRDDDDRVVLLELEDQLLDLLRGDRVERGAGLVHQQHLGLVGQRARDAEPLLLAAREAGARFLQPVLHLVPQGRLPEAPLDQVGQIAPCHEPVERRPVGHVVEDRLGERVRPLEHHPDPLAQRHEVGARREDRVPSTRMSPWWPDARDQLVQPVDRAEEGGLAAARRADDGGDRLPLDAEVQVPEHLPAAVREAEVAHVDRRRAALAGRRRGGPRRERGAGRRDEARLRARGGGGRHPNLPVM